MANVRVTYDKKVLGELASEPEIKQLMLSVGAQVAAEATATAQEAQKGPGGTISGYAEAGFDVIWEPRGKRPRVVIRSNADPETALRVLFHTQKVWGVAHLRRALYKFTTRGG